MYKDMNDYSSVGSIREIRFPASTEDFGIGEDIPLEITIEYGEDDATPSCVWVCNSWVRRPDDPVQHFLVSTNVPVPFAELVPDIIVPYLKTDADTIQRLKNLLPELRQPSKAVTPQDLTGQCTGSGLYDPTSPDHAQPLPFGSSLMICPGGFLSLPTRSNIELKLEVTFNPELNLYFCELWMRIHIDPLRLRILTYTAPVSGSPELDAWDFVENNHQDVMIREMGAYVVKLQERDPKYVPGDPFEVLPRLARECGIQEDDGSREARRAAKKTGNRTMPRGPVSMRKKKRRRH